MRGFLRALGRALWLTLRGKSPLPAHYQPLQTWIERCLPLLARVEAAARRERLDLAALQLKLDGRPSSLAQSLQMLRHNLTEEYPRLMRLDDPFSMAVVQSSNFNDQYRLGQFLAADCLSSAGLRQTLEALHQHLGQLPLAQRE